MKVLIFADFRSPHALGWADGLESAGFDICRVSSLGAPGGPTDRGLRGGAGRQMVRRLSHEAGNRVRTAEALARQPDRRRELRAIAKTFRPDIVHVLRLPYEGVSGLSALGDRLPVVVSTWGQDFVAQAAADPVLRIWIRRVLPRAAGLIVDVAGDIQLARQFGLARVPTLVAAANFGIEAAEPRQVDRSSPTITYTRGMTTHVNYKAFLSAIPAIASRAKLPVKFVGIGLASAPEARNLTRNPLLVDRVQLTGHVDVATFNALVRASAATCSPATSDGMPVSVLTSLAEGCTTLVGPLPQYDEIAAATPLLRVMTGTDERAITEAILALDDLWASGPLKTMTGSYVPPTYNRARNHAVVPEFYEQVLRERRR